MLPALTAPWATLMRLCRQMALLVLCVTAVLEMSDAAGSQEPKGNFTEPENNTCSREASPCKEGLLVPMWLPQGNLAVGDVAARATVYMVVLIYLFLGVSIIADRFMAAIEVITSKEKEVVIKKNDGTKQIVNVRIWNETVSNLTLMALGSSAPEILLSIIEVCGNEFNAGELGPGTIVGSAAFNLFIIIAICVYVIPRGEVRKIKHLRVFFITATWSIFAYLWLYFILAISSHGIVEIWEAVLTFIFFPLTVLTAYIADTKIFVNRFLSKKYTATKTSKTAITNTVNPHDMETGVDGKPEDFTGLLTGGESVREFEAHRHDFIEILRQLRKKNPHLDMKTLEEMAEYEAVNKGPKSRAFYRIQATRLLTGGGNVIKKAKKEKSTVAPASPSGEIEDNVAKVFFDPGHYTVMENVGHFNVTVTREGGDMSRAVHVDYRTEDGTASDGADYIGVSGTLVFQPQEKHRQFEIVILDDDVFEEDEHFYVHLSNPRITGPREGEYLSGPDNIVLVTPFTATVMILDDDHPGVFHFEVPEMTVSESVGEVEVKVIRSSGARGRVRVPYFTVDGTATTGKDYTVVGQELVFDNDIAEHTIRVKIVDDEEYEKTESFTLVLGDPILEKKETVQNDTKDEIRPIEPQSLLHRFSIPFSRSVGESKREAIVPAVPTLKTEDGDDAGIPILGEIKSIKIAITESQEFKKTVDKLLKQATPSSIIGTSSWKEQFVAAVTVSSGDDAGDDGVEKLPSCMDYMMHFLTLFWKLMFAFVPPTDYFGGWACFIVSIIVIGVITAVIGDIAAGFGCTVGLKDSVTAISFVALGTSVPDTFASKVAAVNDRYADSSIGNVTGSNAVNVFLGIGIAWTIAAVYHAIHGRKFEVPPGNLAMSVTVFCILALLTIVIMMARRHKFIGGELGGPRCIQILTTVTLSAFWILYLLISSLVIYCYIPGF
ncbi:sodium/calcium exchanger 1-like isoform X3 [Physella acuta]|uniref:sodium/calcium exchanger 1-like isoform X3 n=1 Tax=Physella acuta TaxID=109671 RepID=UPI0027DE7316|nr:sodium/calcium exchanger 1-like isoform X3 [Physella acuta]